VNLSLVLTGENLAPAGDDLDPGGWLWGLENILLDLVTCKKKMNVKT
jgi:hypothetical protein